MYCRFELWADAKKLTTKLTLQIPNSFAVLFDTAFFSSVQEWELPDRLKDLFPKHFHFLYWFYIALNN